VEGRPTRLHWAVGLAALVGGEAGAFLAASLNTLALSTEGSRPLLAGGAAIYVGSLLGAVVGAAIAALVAFGVGRAGYEVTAAIGGSLTGLLGAGLVGYYSEPLAQAWINAFSGDPLAGALAGGAIAAGFAGVGAVAVLRALSPPASPGRRRASFAALIGSVAGFLVGIGGASIGSTLAESVSPCPNGYYGNPFTPGPCVPGLLQGSLLVGMWVGAVVGAATAVLASVVLARLGGDTTA
jgi:hypothetical protein